MGLSLSPNEIIIHHDTARVDLLTNHRWRLKHPSFEWSTNVTHSDDPQVGIPPPSASEVWTVGIVQNCLGQGMYVKYGQEDGFELSWRTAPGSRRLDIVPGERGPWPAPLDTIAISVETLRSATVETWPVMPVFQMTYGPSGIESFRLPGGVQILRPENPDRYCRLKWFDAPYQTYRPNTQHRPDGGGPSGTFGISAAELSVVIRFHVVARTPRGQFHHLGHSKGVLIAARAEFPYAERVTDLPQLDSRLPYVQWATGVTEIFSRPDGFHPGTIQGFLPTDAELTEFERRFDVNRDGVNVSENPTEPVVLEGQTAIGEALRSSLVDYLGSSAERRALLRRHIEQRGVRAAGGRVRRSGR